MSSDFKWVAHFRRDVLDKIFIETEFTLPPASLSLVRRGIEGEV